MVRFMKRRLHQIIDGIDHTQCSGSCKQMKPVCDFNYNKRTWDGLSHVCKSCTKEYLDVNTEHYRQYRQETRKRRAENHARWYRENKQRVFGYMYARYRNNPQVRLKQLASHRIYIMLKKAKVDKQQRSIDYVGCTLEQLQCHLEKKFDEYMTWENQGTWHIDHKIPASAFDMTNPVEQKAAFHYTNLQPMWGSDNIKKGDRYDPNDKAEYMRIWREMVV